MGTTPGRRHSRHDRVAVFFAVVTAAVLFSTPVFAVEFGKKKVKGSWDTTVSFGVSWRLDDPDPALIGLANGGEAFGVNGDDGNLNYETGIFSTAPKINTELEVRFGEHFGFFVRGFAFYDYENENQDRARTPLTDGALDRVGSRAELRDAYVWTRFHIGSQPAQIRIGQQVLSWGESTFIQGGINTINPVDVSAIRVPGAELKEALLPVGMVWGSFGLSQNWTLETFYQYEWEEVHIDPPGTYFSTNDFAGAGGDTVFLGFGDSGDIPPFSDPRDPTRPFLGVPRAANVEPDDQGQYGAALRWFVPKLGGTEFALYYINYHSRLPTINGRTGILSDNLTNPFDSNTGALAAAGAGTATQAALVELGTSGDAAAAIAAGTVAGDAAGATQQFAGLVSTAVVGTTLAGGDGAAVGSAFAVDAYSQTARYFIAYPEDIKLFGLSFNTQLGTSGVALQGELSYRQDVPLQADDVELLFAALAPINPVFAGNSGIPGEPGASQLVSYFDEDYSTQFETDIPGTILQDTWQFQTTATKVFGPGLGASQSVLLGEFGVHRAPDLPDKDELRMESAATYTSGNPYHEAANPGAAHVGKPAEDAMYFADGTSWGYRIVGRLDYLNAIGAVGLHPRFGWRHDVSGNTPGPGGSFLEGRKALTLGLGFSYLNAWSADLSYTRYQGAGRHNLIGDRDFIGANIKYSF